MDAQERAENLFAAVSAGQTVFFQAGSEWCIIGPADTITSSYQRVQVTKKDGLTVEVVTKELYPVREIRGLRTQVASFTRPAMATVSARPASAQVHRQAQQVADIAGLPMPAATRGCYYCGMPLVNGACGDCG